ncbi:MAG: thioredoxin [Eubacteriales bacterium]|nr:thioredoxin [Eubacteriales bacterium]
MAKTFTSENFKSEVLQSELPVLVDFWAEWCGPCRMVTPLIETLAEAYDGRAKVGKINVDEQSELAFQYHVSSIPTLILFKNGEVLQRITGARPYEELEAFLKQAL